MFFKILILHLSIQLKLGSSWPWSYGG